MIKQSTQLYFTRVLLCLALLGFSVDNICTYVLVEVTCCGSGLPDLFDTNGEGESDAEADEKVRINGFSVQMAISHTSSNSISSNQLFSIPHPEIFTPPPEFA